jgi:hypothetical protein
MLTRTGAKLLDFAIAIQRHIDEATETLTWPNRVTSALSYTAPEPIRLSKGEERGGPGTDNRPYV